MRIADLPSAAWVLNSASAICPPPKAVAIVMSALPPKADMCGATRDVCFGPKADIPPVHSITSLARSSNLSGTSMPSDFAVWVLTAMLNFVGCTTGKFAGFSPFRIRPA